ncbi:MAG: L-seryl-tRNA(Sec) selenium transferase [Alphaproteobacteria bacterium MarineAlpha11_Bin1]|nr:MAG: L-seryl-tRNA(Sec) selenium transferase [Alphaproteobacteria bacterium MarineAlpha11_Bin1]|tara:strand:+ start:2493 stop:3896 length:1404 start_codon:yes stop_codon:yes gene_type:complete
MPKKTSSPLAGLSSVDRLLNSDNAVKLISEYGRKLVTDCIRKTLEEIRGSVLSGNKIPHETEILYAVAECLAQENLPSLRPVYNLTGTVIHTNLGRAALPEEAIEAISRAARSATNLEYSLEEGKRGDRDDHVEAQLCEITGAEAATVVNNNAAAVMLILNTFALGKETPTSRGELIEIGGSFRMPDIMAQSGCELVEVGTTNRTHLKDYAAAIGPNTGMIMKVHTSNYVVEGFTAEVPETDLAKLCHETGIPFAIDLGSGTLTELKRLGLPHEPTPMEALKHGADMVSFSGDKLLGGPQAGIIVGTKDCITRLKSNPIKRALRCDKMTIAALSAVLRLYSDPDSLSDRLPTLRALTRSVTDIQETASRIRPAISRAVKGFAKVEEVDCDSQVGSGTLPTRKLPSAGLAITPETKNGAAVERLVRAFRGLPVPVIGRVQGGAFIVDLRCMADEPGFLSQLSTLEILE